MLWPEPLCILCVHALQREGIKTYCSNLIIKISTDEKAFRSERTFLNKLNLVRMAFQRGWGYT